MVSMAISKPNNEISAHSLHQQIPSSPKQHHPDGMHTPPAARSKTIQVRDPSNFSSKKPITPKFAPALGDGSEQRSSPTIRATRS
ncbi:hypothetical protein ACLOJK_004314 [Asimina triloba]